MQRSIFPAIIVAVTVSSAAWAQPLSLMPPAEDGQQDARPILVAAQGPQARSELGGGFIEFLFGGGSAQPRYRNAEPDAEPGLCRHRAGRRPAARAAAAKLRDGSAF